MSKALAISWAILFFAAGMLSHASVASALPAGDALAIKNSAPSNIETVRWRGGWRRGGRGWGPGAGFAAGAILGGMLAAPYYYPGPGYYYGPGPGDPVGYCMQRFKSYDPSSGTYLGYDGFRHPCP